MEASGFLNRRMPSPLHPIVFGPILTNLVMGFIVGFFLKRIFWCLIALPIIPLVTAFAWSYYPFPDEGLFVAGDWETAMWGRVFFVYRFVYGFVPCGMSLLLGYFLRRALRRT